MAKRNQIRLQLTRQRRRKARCPVEMQLIHPISRHVHARSPVLTALNPSMPAEVGVAAPPPPPPAAAAALNNRNSRPSLVEVRRQKA